MQLNYQFSLINYKIFFIGISIYSMFMFSCDSFEIEFTVIH